jgi:hypothetical protein
LILLAFQLFGLGLLLLVLLTTPGLGPVGAALAIALLTLLSVPYQYAALRPFAVLLVCGLLCRAHAEPDPTRRGLLASAAGAGAVAAQLISLELGIYAASAVLAWYLALYARGRLVGPELSRAELGTLATFCTAAAVSEALLLVLLTPGSGTLYLRDARLMLGGYPLTMGLPWQLAAGPTLALLGTVLLLAGEIGLSWWRRGEAATTHLLCLAFASLVCLEGGLVRADPAHVALACTPLLVVLLARGLVALGERSWTPVVTTLAAAALVPAWWPYLDPHISAQAVYVLLHPRSVERHLGVLRSSQVAAAEVTGPELAAAASGVRRPLAIVPHQSHLAGRLGRPLAAPVLQAYAAHLPDAQADWVRRVGLEEGADVAVVLDTGFDGVQTPTRLPLLWKALMCDYEPSPDRVLDGRTLVLRKRARALGWTRSSVGFTQGAGAEPWRIELDHPLRCDLIELELSLGYPAWARLLHPAAIRVLLSDGETPAQGGRLVPFSLNGVTRTLMLLGPEGAEARSLLGVSGAVPTWDVLELQSEQALLAPAPHRVQLDDLACLELREPG